MYSLTGISVKCVHTQKLLNFFHPAEYVALVGAKPSVIKYWAFCCSCWVKVVILDCFPLVVTCSGGRFVTGRL